MSPTLLSKRLHELAAAGVVERRMNGTDVSYVLTEAGQELRPVVEALGAWGTRWMGRLGDPDLDPKLLLWDMHRGVDSRALPPGRTVVQFHFPDVAGRSGRWWLVLTADGSDVCDEDPGYEVDVTVQVGLRRMVEIWLGDLSWSTALRSGDLRLVGPSELCRALPRWFTLSVFAAIPRPAEPLNSPVSV
jgi:hypothetical protein